MTLMIVMERKTAREIISSITDSLSSGPKAINQIAKSSGINWETVKHYLDILKDVGLLEEKEEGNSRVFYLREGSAPQRGDTLFGLPVDEKDEELINHLFFRIRKVWEERAGYVPGKTQVQKALVDVDKECRLNLPIGMYKYGRLCVKFYNPETVYTLSENVENRDMIDSCVVSVVDRLKKYRTTRQLRLYQYHEDNNRLYMAKENLMNMLFFQKMNEKTLNAFSDALVDLIRYFPKEDDDINRGITALINEYIGVSIQVMRSTTEDDMILLKEDIVSSFETVWELIATYCLYYTLKATEKYDEHLLHERLMCHIKKDMLSAREEIFALNECAPRNRAEEESEELRKFREMQGFIKREVTMLSKNERKKSAEDMVRVKDSDLFGTSGFD
jgi:predicted transcriptional regulator